MISNLQYCGQKMLDNISILNSTRFDLSCSHIILEIIPCAHEKKFSNVFEWMSCRYQLSSSIHGLFMDACVSVLIFYLDDLSIGVSGGVNVPECYGVIYDFPFIVVILALWLKCLFFFWWIYTYYILFLDRSLDHYSIFSLVFVMIFILKYILSDIILLL